MLRTPTIFLLLALLVACGSRTGLETGEASALGDPGEVCDDANMHLVSMPPGCVWRASPPFAIAETPPNGRVARIITSCTAEAIVSYSSLEETPTRPRTVAALDMRGRPIGAPSFLFDAAIGETERHDPEIAPTGFGMVARAYGTTRGCELRPMDGWGEPVGPIVSFGAEVCRNMTRTESGFLMLAGLEGTRRFVSVTSVDPLVYEEGAAGWITADWSFDFIALPDGRVLASTAPLNGPVRVGLLDWRTGVGEFATVDREGPTYQNFRLLPFAGGYLFGYLAGEPDDGNSMVLWRLDRDGRPIGEPSRVDAPRFRSGWLLRQAEGGRAVAVLRTIEPERETALAVVDIDPSGAAGEPRVLDVLEGMRDIWGAVVSDGSIVVAYSSREGRLFTPHTVHLSCTR